MKTVEILDDDDLIEIDDEYSTTSIYLFSKNKQFNVNISLKNDCYYSYETYEYKISVSPIEIYLRLIESSNEPPKEYTVKDGVVLESEIIKGKEAWFLNRAKERITELKKQVEWQKVQIFDQYEINLYILSKHPEIITSDDYRRFLRQSTERIKLGVTKVETLVKESPIGLEIRSNEYGKGISFIESESDKIDSDAYWKEHSLLDNTKNIELKSKESERYERKLDLLKKFEDDIFSKTSLNFAGIERFELTHSEQLIQYINDLLGEKSIPQDVTVSPSNRVRNPWYKTKWLIVIILSVTALSVGVWTAIGIFILGSIIVSLLSK